MHRIRDLSLSQGRSSVKKRKESFFKHRIRGTYGSEVGVRVGSLEEPVPLESEAGRLTHKKKNSYMDRSFEGFMRALKEKEISMMELNTRAIFKKGQIGESRTSEHASSSSLLGKAYKVSLE